MNIPTVGYIGFTQSSYTEEEGNGIMDVCVELLGYEKSYVLGKPLSVRINSDGDTAEGKVINAILTQEQNSSDPSWLSGYTFSAAGVDFLPIAQITYFPPGSEPGHRSCVPIPIVDDSLEEQIETFTLHLFVYDTAIVVTNDVAVGGIVDNDGKRHYS